MIRPLNPVSDAGRYAELAAQLGYPVDLTVARARLEAELQRPDRAVFVWDEPGFGVAGWVGCREEDAAYAGAWGDLSGLVVDEAFRGRRIGAALLAAAEEWFRGRGLDLVRVRSGGQRTDAHRFYEREGYTRVKTQVIFRKRL